jgi:RimJ/RimL family protein N-acetyltransferase
MSNPVTGLPPLPETEALRLRTKRLDLLPIAPEHAAEMFEFLNDPALHAYTGGSPPPDVDALRRLYRIWERRIAPDGSELWLNWAVRLRKTGALIGHVQAGVGPDHADVAWVVGTKWQGHGYATEAARGMLEALQGIGVPSFHASIHPMHEASIRIAERLGLHRTDETVGGEQIWVLTGGKT